MNILNLKFKLTNKNLILIFHCKLSDRYQIIGKKQDKPEIKVKRMNTNKTFACKIIQKNIEELSNNKIDAIIELAHWSIAKPYEIIISERNFYLIMEECRGGELFDFVKTLLNRNEKLTDEEAKIIFFSIMKGLCRSHRKGFCHRDIKFENVMLLLEGREE